MELDEKSKKAVQELGDAINEAIEKSRRVMQAIDDLRELGYEPNLGVKLEIGLMRIEDEDIEIGGERQLEMELTDEDLRELRKMKISLE